MSVEIDKLKKKRVSGKVPLNIIKENYVGKKHAIEFLVEYIKSHSK